MDLSRVPLAVIRARFDASGSPRSARRLVDALRRDPRRGAGILADAIERRLAEERLERRRLARLFARSRRLAREGARVVAGVDEVGMGPLAGPVVAAAVVLPQRVLLPGLRDSKRLTPRAREELAQRIRSEAVAVSIGCVSPREIDRLNIYRAGLEAMRRAVHGLALPPDHVLVDARTIPGIDAPQSAIVRGDQSEGPIAAASVVAKVHRDALMKRLDRRYPGYDLGRHMGYATRAHLEALRTLGPSPVHRRSFAPVSGH